ncbi:MAG: GNAT family N-acetyltransferase [Thermomicrobiales bacterium]
MATQTPTRVTIRPFAPDDYAAALAVSNAVYSDYANTVEEWRYNDEHRDPKCYFARYVAERDGAIVAIGECGQSAGMFHPRKFFIGVTVHPAWQGQGIGTSLYDHITASLDFASPSPSAAAPRRLARSSASSPRAATEQMRSGNRASMSPPLTPTLSRCRGSGHRQQHRLHHLRRTRPRPRP